MNDEVTRQDVERLWAEAIAGRNSREDVSRKAQELIERVNAETPIVNWGLIALYEVKWPYVPADAEALTRSRERWRAQIAEYDADPQAWMRGYFRRMIADFAAIRGVDAALAFGRNLVDQGELTDADVRAVVGQKRRRVSDSMPRRVS